MVALGPAPPTDAGTSDTTATVRHVAGESAAHIGLIGDSTLSGVRWFDDYGALEQYNFVFDAESCRRTIERSCWSREQYRARNALTALQDETGQWGEVLVVMTGYNDSADRFDDGVEAVVAEAQIQGVGSVIWLSLRTQGVDYEEPLHLANGSTYRGSNRSLYDLAAQFGGYLQIADWATHSAGSPDWFESDGAHLTPVGADALTTFISGHVGAVLAGGTITPTPPPWEEVREGDEGEIVVSVQQALIAAGAGAELTADGVFGPQTAAAVAAFQRTSGLVESGAVDGPTAAALGLYQPSTTSADVGASTTPNSVLSTGDATAGSDQVDGEGLIPGGAWWMAVVAGVPVVWLVRRRRMVGRSDRSSEPAAFEDESDPSNAFESVAFEPEGTLPPVVPYDHALEHDEGARSAPDPFGEGVGYGVVSSGGGGW